jgi:hypothetical protein
MYREGNHQVAFRETLHFCSLRDWLREAEVARIKASVPVMQQPYAFSKPAGPLTTHFSPFHYLRIAMAAQMTVAARIRTRAIHRRRRPMASSDIGALEINAPNTSITALNILHPLRSNVSRCYNQAMADIPRPTATVVEQ